MSKPKVLIVGCGAVGLSQGYQLSTGADITYLVRPGRKPAFAPPKRLYSYKDDKLHTFEDYRVVESPAEVSGETFAFVFDTLDGHTARSESGVATLRAVGELVREEQNKDCFVMYDAIGLEIEKHYADTMRISTSRLFLAGSMLAHQPTPSISIPPSASRDLIAQADLLYSNTPPNTGLLVFNTRPQLTAKLEAVYNNGPLKVQRIPGFLADFGTLLAMLHLITWNIDGFQSFSHLRGNRDLWHLMIRAQGEILSLPRFGWTGWALSWVLGGWATEKMNVPMIEAALPLKYEEFNAFHHGGKVVKQDLLVLEDLLRDGESVGRKMKALEEIVKRADEVERKKAEARG